MKLTYLESAEKVLTQLGSGRSMNYRDITDKAITDGYLSPSGLTPELTMHSQLSREISRCENDNRICKFYSEPNGKFGLNKKNDSNLIVEIEKHKEKIRDKILKELEKLNQKEIEELGVSLLEEMGFFDIEVFNNNTKENIKISAVYEISKNIKLYSIILFRFTKSNVSSRSIQELRGSVNSDMLRMVVTNRKFNQSALDEASNETSMPVTLLNGSDLVDLLLNYKIGVNSKMYEYYEFVGFKFYKMP